MKLKKNIKDTEHQIRKLEKGYKKVRPDKSIIDYLRKRELGKGLPTPAEPEIVYMTPLEEAEEELETTRRSLIIARQRLNRQSVNTDRYNQLQDLITELEARLVTQQQIVDNLRNPSPQPSSRGTGFSKKKSNSNTKMKGKKGKGIGDDFVSDSVHMEKINPEDRDLVRNIGNELRLVDFGSKDNAFEYLKKILSKTKSKNGNRVLYNNSIDLTGDADFSKFNPDNPDDPYGFMGTGLKKKKPTNSWISYVKDYAKKHNIR
jgi:hypothetical protein